MTQDFVIHLAQNAVMLVLILCAPILGIGLFVGLAVSIFQATTQIQEQTLSFIPKIVAILVSLILFGPWILNHLVEFTYSVIVNIPKNL